MISIRDQRPVHLQAQQEAPFISVIIPCHNGEAFICEAIESVRKQTHPHWELIVVDDGSTDGSSSVVEAYLADHRIQLVCHPTTQGTAATKNTGVSAARGEYVAFLDQDDLWTENKLELQINRFLSAREVVGVVCTGMLFVDGDMGVRDIFTGFEDRCREDLLKSLFLKPINSSSIMMVKKSIFSEIGLFNEALIGWDDYEFLFRSVGLFHLRYVREPLVIKRVYGNNMQNSSPVKNERYKVFDQMVYHYPFLREYRHIRDGIDTRYEGKALLTVGDRGAARRKLEVSMKRHPGSIYPMLLFLFSFLPCGALKRAMKHLDNLSSLTNSIRARNILRRGAFVTLVYDQLSRKQPTLKDLQ